MDKKILIIITIVLVVLLGIVIVVFLFNKNINHFSNSNNFNESELESGDNHMNNNIQAMRKSAVIYFSATGTTKEVAEKISEVTNSDIIEIIPTQKYTSEDLSYNNDNCRANQEQNDENARPEIQNKINVDDYDVIYLGYPIWWGTAPKIIFTLLDNYNFNGKNVILFCTSGGSGISQSVSDIKEYNRNMNVLDGRKFNSSVSKNEIESWINNLK